MIRHIVAIVNPNTLLKTGKSALVAAFALMLTQVARADFFDGTGSAGTSGVTLGEAGRTHHWAVFTLGSDASSVSGNGGILGATGTYQSAFGFNDNAYMNGNFIYNSAAGAPTFGSKTTHTTAPVQNDTLTANARNDALSASSAAFAKTPNMTITGNATIGTPPINMTGNSSYSIGTASTSGTIVLTLDTFQLASNATFTLQGTAAASYIINVKGTFSLAGNSQIVLKGGLTAGNVIFNLVTTAPFNTTTATLSGNSIFRGILLAPTRSVVMSNNASVSGEVIAKSITMSGNSTVKIVSP